jgi:hypothetical protein
MRELWSVQSSPAAMVAASSWARVADELEAAIAALRSERPNGDALVVGRHLLRLEVGEGEDPEVDERLLDLVAPQPDPLDRRNDACEELLAVDAHDLRLLEVVETLVDRETEVVVELLGHDAVAQEAGGLDDELLALAALRFGEIPVGVLQRQQAEGDVTRFVFHHVGVEGTRQRMLGEVADQ